MCDHKTKTTYPVNLGGRADEELPQTLQKIISTSPSLSYPGAEFLGIWEEITEFTCVNMREELILTACVCYYGCWYWSGEGRRESQV